MSAAAPTPGRAAADASPRMPTGIFRWKFMVIVTSRWRQLSNAVDQHLRDAPWQSLALLLLMGLIWSALYVLLEHVMRRTREWGLVGVVADQQLFVHFFLVLAIMLAFSNAVLMFGNLYSGKEAAHLLSMPVHARHVVTVKWIEGVFLSSWSFMLLGVPLMMAAANSTNVAWFYYPLFLAHFVGFVIIPSSLGLIAAWAVAMWLPRKPVAVAVGAGIILLLLVILWFGRLSHGNTESEQMLRQMFAQVSVIKQPWLPWTWTASGIVSAINQELSASLFYLGVVLANGCFLSWLTVNILAGTWPEAYSRAQLGRANATIRTGWPTLILNWMLFFYLPSRSRELMLKDLRGFARDARQWSQMVIMLGLLVIYVLNLQRLPVDLSKPAMKILIAFLNLATVTLILATFTSRFIYPLLSLEGQQLWLVEMLPVRRSTLLLVKFHFATVVTVLSGAAVMTLASRVLQLPPLWARVNLGICISVCIGLSGLAIGLGARFPVLGQRNPARIASGLGGTINLIMSMLLVTVELAGIAFVGAKSFGYLQYTDAQVLVEAMHPDAETMLYGLLLLGPATALVSLLVGIRHFEKLEV